MKRGISPLIATVLIIGFTLILGVIVMTWGLDLYKNYQNKTTSESKVALKCSNLDFSIKEACIFGNSVNVVLENTGNEDVNGFLYRVRADDGIDVKDNPTKLTQYSKNLLEFNFNVLTLGQPKEIEIFPKIDLDGKEFICSYARKKEIKNCFTILDLEEKDKLETSNPGDDPIGTVIKKDNFKETLINLGISDNILMNKIPPADYVLVSFGTHGSVYTNSFVIPSKDEITHISVFGETNIDKIKLTLVNEEKNEVKSIYVPSSSDLKTAFQWKTPIDNDLKGKTLRLKIDFDGLTEQSAYQILYRFCYTDAYSGCIV